jgi:hypothetical protein
MLMSNTILKSTRVLLIVDTCCTFFDCTIFFEANFRSTVLTS